MKTLCASMFIVSVVQHMKIGDLSIQQGGMPLSSTPAEEMMDIDGDDGSRLPSGTGETPILSREEERALARDSTASFAGKCDHHHQISRSSLFYSQIGLYPYLGESSPCTRICLRRVARRIQPAVKWKRPYSNR